MVKVSREMGGRYSARECKLQYARDYKAVPLFADSFWGVGLSWVVKEQVQCALHAAKDKMRKQASGQNRVLVSFDRVPFCLLPWAEAMAVG